MTFIHPLLQWYPSRESKATKNIELLVKKSEYKSSCSVKASKVWASWRRRNTTNRMWSSLKLWTWKKLRQAKHSMVTQLKYQAIGKKSSNKISKPKGPWWRAAVIHNSDVRNCWRKLLLWHKKKPGHYGRVERRELFKESPIFSVH